MAFSAGLAIYALSYELSPIIFTGGIASGIPGGMLPIVAITEALNFTDGLLSGGSNLDFENFFAHFWPLPGSSLIDNRLGEYPFANQAVAANAIIAQPLVLSFRMVCPAKGASGASFKTATMMALQSSFKQHNQQGGTYTCVTPAGFYPNGIMIGMRDTSATEDKQAQNTYQIDFRFPLLTLQDAIQAQNSLMSQITAGTQINGQPSLAGYQQNVGVPPSLVGSSVAPSLTGPVGSSIASANPIAGPIPQ